MNLYLRNDFGCSNLENAPKVCLWTLALKDRCSSHPYAPSYILKACTHWDTFSLKRINISKLRGKSEGKELWEDGEGRDPPFLCSRRIEKKVQLPLTKLKYLFCVCLGFRTLNITSHLVGEFTSLVNNLCC